MRPAIAFLLIGVHALACRVMAVPGDSAADQSTADSTEARDLADSAAETDSLPPTAQVCDLLLQNCSDKRACYPDGVFSGATRCVFAGSAGPLAPCLLHEECDVRSICFDRNRDGFTVCSPLCDPDATPTGCERNMRCQRLTNYRAGTCTF